MTDPVTCATCRYFRPDAHNPSAAMGRCYADARHGYFYPDDRHRCGDHEAKAESAPGE